MSLFKTMLAAPYIPWRLRNGLEQWTERRARLRFPSLYRFLHFGQVTNPVTQATSGPLHHFFGYYDKTPWNASQTLLLAHEAGFNDRPPGPDDTVKVGVVHLNGNNRFQALGESHAWNWQQGAMMQWHPGDPERQFFHNDRRDGRFVGILRDVEKGEVAEYERPIYAVAPDGKSGYSLNFARLATHRPGYGYAGGCDNWQAEPHPAQDGIYRIDLNSGASELVVSLDQLARSNPTQVMQGVFHWVNHIQVNPSGSRFAFFHLWREGENGWGVRLYTADRDGGDLRCALDTGRISHYDWLDDHRILVWAKEPGLGDRFLVVDARDGSRQVFGEGDLTEDGHCTFSPDRRWVLNDTYPDAYDMRTLMLVSWPQARRHDLARLYSPKSRWWGEIRCDLHPRWSRDGKKICIDSVHDGSRQMYIVDVSKVVA